MDSVNTTCDKCDSKALLVDSTFTVCTNNECENHKFYEALLSAFKLMLAEPGYEEDLKDFPVARCDGCDASIKRAPKCRFKCTTCEDFDFCGGCLCIVPHTEGHEFVDYHAPLTQ